MTYAPWLWIAIVVAAAAFQSVRNAAQRCDEDANIVWYRVEAENFESIHNHNAYALVEKA